MKKLGAIDLEDFKISTEIRAGVVTFMTMRYN
jgi:xanthine/uracil/vitamin C permease (AzgA family)